MRTIFLIGNIETLEIKTWDRAKRFVFENAENTIKEFLKEDCPMIINPLKEAESFALEWKATSKSSPIDLQFSDLIITKQEEVLFRRLLLYLEASSEVYLIHGEPKGKQQSQAYTEIYLLFYQIAKRLNLKMYLPSDMNNIREQ